MAQVSDRSPSLISDLVWALRRGLLAALFVASLVVVPWLVVGVIETLIRGVP